MLPAAYLAEDDTRASFLPCCPVLVIFHLPAAVALRHWLPKGTALANFFWIQGSVNLTNTDFRSNWLDQSATQSGALNVVGFARLHVSDCEWFNNTQRSKAPITTVFVNQTQLQRGEWVWMGVRGWMWVAVDECGWMWVGGWKWVGRWKWVDGWVAARYAQRCEKAGVWSSEVAAMSGKRNPRRPTFLCAQFAL